MKWTKTHGLQSFIFWKWGANDKQTKNSKNMFYQMMINGLEKKNVRKNDKECWGLQGLWF